MTHLAFQCYRGRSELDIVNQVETIDANRALREHYGCLTHAVSMLEAADQVAQDRQPNPALYRMLVRALLTLAADPSPLVSGAFFWKLLSLEGFHPMLDECVRCGATEDGGGADGEGDGAEFVAFDLDEGGILCVDCGRFAGKRISSEALVQLRRILGGDLRAALAEPPGPATVETERLGLSSLEHHLERKLRSAALL
jgi:DNA repair protein RecO (recombination protein O)